MEFALVAPLFFLLLFGIMEMGRGMMVQQMMVNATREGAREAALPEATVSSVKASVVDFLTDSSINIGPEDVTVSPNPATAFNNEQISVELAILFSDVSWIPGSHLADVTLRASTKMRSERLD